jgi:type I restriction enzyme S subunit
VDKENNSQSNNFVPELRFGDFDGEWTNTNVLNLVKDGILLKPQDGNHGEIHPKSSDYVEKGIPFIMSNNIQSGNLDL